VKVAVYNKHWTTGGGGERYAGAFAQALAGEHQVELLAPEPIDWVSLEERLGIDLSGTTPRLVADEGYGSLTRATRGYDLLVNCSYMSSEASGARRGIYVVLFPTPFDHDMPAAKRLAARALRAGAKGGDPRLEWGRGFYPPEWSRLSRFRWTCAAAHLLVRAEEGEVLPVRLRLAGGRPPEVGAAEVEVDVEDRVVARVRADASRRSTPVSFSVTGRGVIDPVVIAIRSDVFVPSIAVGTTDTRELGVQLRAVQLGSGLRARLRSVFPRLASPPVSLDFLDGYRIVSISNFTREWVHRFWKRDSEVLYPPVPQREPGEKARLILSVGRFFGREAGHSKKQLEMVRAFRRLARGGLHGFDYHLVGGCSREHLPYLDEVRREAEGLPVHIHVDATGAELDSLYRRASIFWHAAGLGESERKHPHRFEHFGITTVEAMTAGAVPIVLGRAGQSEIVEHGVSGLHFASLEELVTRTRAVITDDELRRKLAEGARRRAADFAPERFDERALALVEKTLA
jgi:glycosyltransferase involved in cell wall biosynthesis